MTASDPYDKHYWRFADEYPEIFNDDGAYALWGRLLRLAGMAWPSAATLPYGTKKRPLALLTQADPPLVLMESGGQYRIRGMDKERGKRQQAGSNAARTRWARVNGATGNAHRNAGGNA